MTDENDDDDRKAKEAVVDLATQRDLERWFGLPSFTQLDEEGKTPQAPTSGMDPEMAAVIERRDKALANIDPVFLESIYARHDDAPEDVLVFEKKIDVRIAETDFGAVDEQLVQRAGLIAEPREYELSDELKDDMKECTPQAMLRDLHRPEKYFDKQLEYPDLAEAGLEPVDAVKETRTAMTTRWAMPKPEEPALVEAERQWNAVRSERRRSWLDYLPALPNRTVRE
jgi:hypothetical protein